MNEDVVVTLEKVLHNNGPYGPVEVEIERSATAPQECTVEPAGPVVEQIVLPTSLDVVLAEEFTIRCRAPSPHGFFFENQVTRIKNAGVLDPDLDNNFASTELAVDVWVQADVGIVEQHVFGCDDLDADTVCDPHEPLLGAPAEIPLGENVPIVVRTVIRNVGPFAPVKALAETIATAPTGCHVTPQRHLQDTPNLFVGLNFTVTASPTIHCDEPGQHTFDFDQAIDANPHHVLDPNAENNTAHTELTVTAS